MENLREKIVEAAAQFGVSLAVANSGSTEAQAATIVKAVTAPAEAAAQIAAEEKPAKRRGRPKKAAVVEEVKAEEAPAAEEVAAVEEPKAEEVAAAPSSAATREDAMNALGALNAKLGISAARKVLGEFQAVRFSELKPETYGAFVDACQAMMMAETASVKA